MEEGEQNYIKHIRFRYVTRGLTPEVIQESVNDTLFKLRDYPVHAYTIEVVTDNAMNLDHCDEIIVPDEYEVEFDGTKTMWKARALHYAIVNYGHDENDWIFHMDEESKLHPDTPKVLFDFIHQNEKDVVGQGIINYDRNQYEGIQHWICTMADNMRTTLDLSIFRLQFLLSQAPLIGMKGSFILINSVTEHQIGFNWGADGNITEDCFVAMKLWQNGAKFKFIPAILQEQSPFNFKDFIKQRSRWFNGLWNVSKSPHLPRKQRAILYMMMVCWTCSLLCWVPLITSFIVQFESLQGLEWFGRIMLANYLFEYVGGITFNYQDIPLFKTALTILLVCPTFIIPILETSAVIYSFLHRQPSFHVVQK